MAIQHTRSKFGKTFTNSYTVCFRYTVNWNATRTAATGQAVHRMYESSTAYQNGEDHIEEYVTPVTYTVATGRLSQADTDIDNALISAQSWDSTSLV